MLAPVISTLLLKLFETFSNTKRAFICVLVAVLMMSSFESTSYSKVWGTSKSLWDHNVNVQPENAFALNNLASTIWQEGNKEPEVFDRVMQLYRKSLLYDSSNIDTLCNVASILGVPFRSESDSNEALKYANLVTQRAPRSLRAVLLVASLHHSRLEGTKRDYSNRVREVKELYSSAVNRDDLAIKDSKQLAKLYHQYGLFLGKHENDVANSLRSHRLAVETSPENLNYIFELGLALQRVGQYEDAASQFRHVVTLRKDDINARLHLAGVLGDSGDIVGASFEYSVVVKQDPHNARAHAGLGNALAVEGRNEEAVKYLERSVELDASLIPLLRDSMVTLYLNLVSKQGDKAFEERLRWWSDRAAGS